MRPSSRSVRTVANGKYERNWDNPTYSQIGNTMKTNLAITCVAFGALLGSTVLASAEEPTYASQTKTFVKDSAITTMIKTKLASEQITSLERIHVDTDTNGVVWLTGSVRTQEAADKIVSVARETDRVTAVHSDIKVGITD
jgi:hyperosmotically inducible periplasmic protein